MDPDLHNECDSGASNAIDIIAKTFSLPRDIKGFMQSCNQEIQKCYSLATLKA